MKYKYAVNVFGAVIFIGTVSRRGVWTFLLQDYHVVINKIDTSFGLEVLPIWKGFPTGYRTIQGTDFWIAVDRLERVVATALHKKGCGAKHGNLRACREKTSVARMVRP